VDLDLDDEGVLLLLFEKSVGGWFYLQLAILDSAGERFKGGCDEKMYERTQP
jgi:hypothetical protein